MVLAPLRVSLLAQTWDQAGLIAALNQMSLENTSWVMDSGRLQPHVIYGWYTSLSPSSLSFLHHSRQWSQSLNHVLWQLYPTYQHVALSFE
jgi:hypothetical protein